MNTNTLTPPPYDAMFSGVIGQEYDMLKLISPYATEMSRLVGETVASVCQHQQDNVNVLELGGGTGITTLALLTASDRPIILSIDNEATMQDQAKISLAEWVTAGRLTFSATDALTALQAQADNSIAIVATAYTLHNFSAEYRLQVLAEIYRVLKPDGQLINGDRYALDDISAHTRATQKEVTGYFKVLTGINRLDLLEHWLVHLFNDESENHIMREGIARQQMQQLGFQSIEFSHRLEVNALLTASKPLTA